jgi:hypothetical protein
VQFEVRAAHRDCHADLPIFSGRDLERLVAILAFFVIAFLLSRRDPSRSRRLQFHCASRRLLWRMFGADQILPLAIMGSVKRLAALFLCPTKFDQAFTALDWERARAGTFSRLFNVFDRTC